MSATGLKSLSILGFKGLGFKGIGFKGLGLGFKSLSILGLEFRARVEALSFRVLGPRV